ncbi:hypothetical protein BAE44_0010456 [Dichanthelium oligosanthes]|uniref:Uncharacterized protein n=1 Tax=Dichanthelium oligosanthes TaxID=888268 RepID=A0A1E5VTS5_9POAL|nr:hypothetical protein BAE44_0010456 [Dichanthelium oligosanthes]
MSDSIHLADNCGELVLVHRMLRPSNDDTQGAKYKMGYEVYRVDLDAGDLVPAKCLGGRAVFMAGAAPSLYYLLQRLSPLSQPILSTWCSIVMRRLRMNRIDGYNVEDGSSEPCHQQHSFRCTPSSNSPPLSTR